MGCKDKCGAFRATKPNLAGRYGQGQKRCQICEIFLKWDGIWCPCCGYRLRTKPRNLKYKNKLRERKGESDLGVNETKNKKQLIGNADGTFTVVEL